MIQNLQKKTLCIHKFPQGKATELPIGAQIRGGDSLTPQVKRMPLHYAKSLFFSALACVHPSFNSNPSPPCNNLCMLCIKSSVPGSDWNKMDITRGSTICKIHSNKLFTGIFATQKTFTGRGVRVSAGTNKTFMRCDGQIQGWDLRLCSSTGIH